MTLRLRGIPNKNRPDVTGNRVIGRAGSFRHDDAGLSIEIVEG